jgi:hypothetical protein
MSTTLDFLPMVLPAGWSILEQRLDGAAYMRTGDGLSVIVSAAQEQDGRQWLHVSCAKRKHLPSWEDLKDVKAIFVGRERVALQVLPQESRYININPYVLHLWACLDGDAVPDFARGGKTI